VATTVSKNCPVTRREGPCSPDRELPPLLSRWYSPLPARLLRASSIGPPSAASLASLSMMRRLPLPVLPLFRECWVCDMSESSCEANNQAFLGKVCNHGLPDRRTCSSDSRNGNRTPIYRTCTWDRRLGFPRPVTTMALTIAFAFSSGTPPQQMNSQPIVLRATLCISGQLLAKNRRVDPWSG